MIAKPFPDFNAVEADGGRFLRETEGERLGVRDVYGDPMSTVTLKRAPAAERARVYAASEPPPVRSGTPADSVYHEIALAYRLGNYVVIWRSALSYEAFYPMTKKGASKREAKQVIAERCVAGAGRLFSTDEADRAAANLAIRKLSAIVLAVQSGLSAAQLITLHVPPEDARDAEEQAQVAAVQRASR